MGLDILTRTENVRIDRLCGHGGYFKTPEAGQRMLSAAVKAPVTVMETAGEGGPYGMALLAAYRLWREKGETLSDYLDGKAFAGAKTVTLTAPEEEMRGFDAFLERYERALPVERTAAELV
jgi:sugar (pentulose or hexulose) kinase